MTLLLNSYGDKADPGLKFIISGKFDERLILSYLQSELETYQIRLYDPIYNKTKRFEAFILRDVLTLAYSDLWQKNIYSEISFEALDGYKAVAKLDKMSKKVVI